MHRNRRRDRRRPGMVGASLPPDAERALRRTFLTLLVAAGLGFCAQPALAGGGSYAFSGGTAKEQATVRSALGASSFDWNLIPKTITVHVGAYGDSYSTYGEVFLDASLLDSGRFSWGVVQHEFAHQVDFFLLDDAKRALLQQQLGGADWCYTTPGLSHAQHGCERFASELAWAYWPSADNSMRPTSTSDEAGSMPVASFRSLLAVLLGVPSVSAAPALVKAYAPAAKPKARRKH
jgi:hypothetical protein